MVNRPVDDVPAIDAAGEPNEAKGAPPAAVDTGTIGPRMRKNRTAARALIVSGGVLGVALPMVPGWPLVVVGTALMAQPKSRAGRLNLWMQRRFPKAHDEAVVFMHRFLDDFEQRFPSPQVEPPEIDDGSLG